MGPFSTSSSNNRPQCATVHMENTNGTRAVIDHVVGLTYDPDLLASWPGGLSGAPGIWRNSVEYKVISTNAGAE